MAYELTDESVEALLKLFERLDLNNNGHLTFQELNDMFLVFNMAEVLLIDC
jgi:Ca2+-binding EF-hand superfamily protein